MIKKRPPGLRLSLLVVALLLANLSGCSASDAPPDKIFYGGPIVTVDPTQPEVEALAVRDGTIVGVGSRARMFRLRGPQTQMVDLKGHTLMPGFVEAHAHVEESSLMHYVFADLSSFSTDTNTLANVKAKLMDSYEKMPVKNGCIDGKCIFLVAYGFDPARTRDDSGNYTFPSLDANDLGAISNETPIVVLNQSLHIAYANNPALAIAGITVGDYCPAEIGGIPSKPGFVCSLENGSYRLTGQANEEGAISTLLKPSFINPIKLIEGVNRTFACWSRAGVTTAADMLSTTDGLLGLARFGPVRIRGYLDRTKFPDPKQSHQPTPFEGDDMLRWIGVKFVTDGSTQGFTAFLRQAYSGQVSLDTYCKQDPTCIANPAGTSNFASPEDLAAKMQPYVDAGWSLALHANGDKGIDWALQAYSQVLRNGAAFDTARYRMRIEHFTVNHPEQMDEVKRLNLTVSMLLGHVYYWGRALRDEIIGLDRASTIGPTAALKSRGIRFSLHSDSPVTPVQPLRLIQTAVTRELQPDPPSTTEVQVLGPDQRILVDEAIRAMTLDAAWQLFADRIAGSLEVGKYADLVELEQNPRTLPAQQIAAIPVVRTYLSGVAQKASLPHPGCYGQESVISR
jgi:predicted amidohydrolase YtcJ